MTCDKKPGFAILLAFILNLSFSIAEYLFGTLFNSSAVLADAVHDMGDALAIGLAYYFERFSQRESDSEYTLGYLRFSLLGALLTSIILIGGSSLVIVESAGKLLNPERVNHEGMLWLGLVAVGINVIASKLLNTEASEQESLLSLHFLEDTLGWVAVIVVALVLRVTDWYFLDPLLSLSIAVFILFKALPKFLRNLQIFLEKRPASLSISRLKEALLTIEGLKAINQFNIWSIDGHHHVAMLHIEVTAGYDADLVRDRIHKELRTYQIIESAIECDKNTVEHHHHS